MSKKIVKKFARSFTLVEILVVLTLISAVSVYSFQQIPVQLQKARDAVRKNQINLIKKGIEEYYQDSGCYPETIPSCKNALVLGDLVINDSLPCDPETKLSYTYVPEVSDCPKWFQIYGNLEYTQDKIIDKIGCRDGCGPNCQFNYGAASTNQNLNPFCSQSQGSNQSDPVPTSTPAPVNNDQYVCSPNGSCEIYMNPELSGCPDIYLNDPTCQSACSDKNNRCHDARGKVN